MSNITNQPVKFITCTDVQYRNLANKENNAIYFVAGPNGNSINIGDTRYNVTVVNNLLTPNYYDVPTTYAVSHELSNKVSRPFIHTKTDATLPATISPVTDNEYRYISLEYSAESPTTSLTVSIPTDYIGYYYTSLILHGIHFANNVSDLIVPASGDGLVSSIKFLNDMELDGKDTVEILLFSNGLDICCISAAYDSTQ